MKATTLRLIFIISLIAFAIVFIFVKPIPQNISYHHFIDAQEIFGIQNFYNVVSNVEFIVAGFYCFYIVAKWNIKTPYTFVLGFGFILTGIGSAYYHFNPNNITLILDRLPMTIVFTTFFAQVLSWYFNKKTAFKIWLLGLLLGIFSVWYWQYTESIGKGDLRLYVLVQYLPMPLMFIIISLNHKKHKSLSKHFIVVALCYFFAKIFESYDKHIYEFTNLIGGHPLKHIAAAMATFYIVGLVKIQSQPNNSNH